MRRTNAIIFTLLPLLLFSTSVDAHLNASHHMGLVDGILHLLTQSGHVVLLLPAIVLALVMLRRTWGKTVK